MLNYDLRATRIAPRVPLWLKAGFTAWVLVWAPAYARHYGPQNFLWFCDIGNFAIAAALWTESRLLFSWQAVSLLLVQTLFTVDLAGRLALGAHPIGGTEYMRERRSAIQAGVLIIGPVNERSPKLRYGGAPIYYN